MDRAKQPSSSGPMNCNRKSGFAENSSQVIPTADSLEALCQQEHQQGPHEIVFCIVRSTARKTANATKQQLLDLISGDESLRKNRCGDSSVFPPVLLWTHDPRGTSLMPTACTLPAHLPTKNKKITKIGTIFMTQNSAWRAFRSTHSHIHIPILPSRYSSQPCLR